MKKKSLFGINAKLALMLVAICGLFASCYEKEELTYDAPSTEAPVYKITGVVSNAISGEPISGATVNGKATAADGSYELTVSAGLNVITVKAVDYKTVTTSVFVETIENGKTAVYNVNAAMYPGKDDVTYKTVKYSIKGTVTNSAGKAITPISVVIAGISNVVVNGNAFSAENVTPGTYSAVITSANYKTVNASINVMPVSAQEGKPEEIQKAVSTVSVVMQQPGEQATYTVFGTITNKLGIGVNGATVKLTAATTGLNQTATTDSKGYFSMVLPFDKISSSPMVTMTVSGNGYLPKSYTFKVAIDPEGATVLFDKSMELESENADEVPDEDPSVGGEATIEVPFEAAEPVATDEALKDENVKSGIEAVAEELGIDLNALKNIPVVEVSSETKMDLTSTEGEYIVNSDGSVEAVTKEVVDQITIPAGTQIYYVNQTAQNVSIKREIKDEKTTAVVRAYDGQPDGAVFSKPLEIAFEAPVTVTAKPDFVFGVLYYSEKNNAWTADKDNYAEYDESLGRFVGKIKHFSKFKFGFETTIAGKDSTNLAKEFIDKPCYTGAYTVNATVKGVYQGGAAYVDGITPEKAVAAKFTGKETIELVTKMLTDYIKADNGNIEPKDSYSTMRVEVPMAIPAYKQVNGFNLVRKQITKSYTIHAIDAGKKQVDVTVSVKKIISVTLEAELAIGHTHGHGHGDDLNAGGGIIDFE